MSEIEEVLRPIRDLGPVHVSLNMPQQAAAESKGVAVGHSSCLHLQLAQEPVMVVHRHTVSTMPGLLEVTGSKGVPVQGHPQGTTRHATTALRKGWDILMTDASAYAGHRGEQQLPAAAADSAAGPCCPQEGLPGALRELDRRALGAQPGKSLTQVALRGQTVFTPYALLKCPHRVVLKP